MCESTSFVYTQIDDQDTLKTSVSIQTSIPEKQCKRKCKRKCKRFTGWSQKSKRHQSYEHDLYVYPVPSAPILDLPDMHKSRRCRSDKQPNKQPNKQPYVYPQCVEEPVKRIEDIGDNVNKECIEIKRSVSELKHPYDRFTTPLSISNELCDFFGVKHRTKFSRTQLVSKIAIYIREHDLTIPGQGGFVPDHTLRKLFRVSKWTKKGAMFTIKHSRLQKFLEPHILKAL